MSDDSGTAAVEFAIVAIPFFALIFAIFQVALVFLADQLLESAVNDASRLIRTGQTVTAGYTVAQFKAEVCSRLYFMFDCNKLVHAIQTPSSFGSINLSPPAVDPHTGLLTGTQNYTNGTSATITVVRVYYQFPVLGSNFGLTLADQANGTRLLGAVAAFRTEPY